MPDVLGLIGSLLGGGNGLFAVLIAALVGTIVAYFRGSANGSQRERAKQDRARIEAMTEAQKIDEAIAGRDAQTNRKELSDRWAKHWD